MGAKNEGRFLLRRPWPILRHPRLHIYLGRSFQKKKSWAITRIFFWATIPTPMRHTEWSILRCIWHLYEGVTFRGPKWHISFVFQGLFWATREFIFFLRIFPLAKKKPWPGLSLARYFGAHSPRKMVGLRFIWHLLGGRNSDFNLFLPVGK